MMSATWKFFLSWPKEMFATFQKKTDMTRLEDTLQQFTACYKLTEIIKELGEESKEAKYLNYYIVLSSRHY